MKRILQIIVAASLLLSLNHPSSTAFAQGTAFTYQGQLQNNGSPASGTYNLTFSLFNTNTSGVAIAGPVTTNGVLIANGLFTVTIDFGGAVWNGATNWLQIGVETNGAASFSSLTPRQQLTPVPYAIFAESSSNLSGTFLASQLTSIGNSAPNADNFFVGPSGNPAASGIDNTAIGYSALLSGGTGSFNTADGAFVLNLNSSGAFNTAYGAEALGFNTSGSYNTADGAYALIYNKSGSNNVAEGYGALEFNTNDDELVAIGSQALQNDNAYGNGNTSDGNGHNTAVGYQALQLTTIGAGNTAIGYQALIQNVNGNENTANGDKALFANQNGSYNTADGVDALYANTSGSFNTANGYLALYANQSGSYNTANGMNALYADQNGSFNTANGYNALSASTNGTYNTANGFYALSASLNGSYNTANGTVALAYNTSGNNNTADGFGSLYFNTNGNNNVAEGFLALEYCPNDSDLVAIGYEALQYDNAASNFYTFSGNGENTAIGFQALQLDTFGVDNTAVGFQSLQLTTIGQGNTAIGSYSLSANTNGSFNTANGLLTLAANLSGSYNVAFGGDAIEQNINGSDNTAIGLAALTDNTTGSSNTADGFHALIGNTTGSGNIGLGYGAGDNLQSGNNNIYIGNTGATSESGIIRIGEPGTQTATYLTGNVSIGGASPGQELSINDGMDVDAAGSDNGTVNNNWTLIFGGAGGGEGIGSVRVASHGDSYGLNFYTDYNKRMTILQNGNVGIGTTNATQLLVVGSGGAYCNGTTWVSTSDRNAKKDFAVIRPAEVLQKISTMPITEWQYKIDPAGIKHIGPMAQDFHAAFGLNGTDDKHISTVDEGGVALAAIQGLNEKVDEKDAEIASLKKQNDSLAGRLNELEAEVKALAQNNH